MRFMLRVVFYSNSSIVLLRLSNGTAPEITCPLIMFPGVPRTPAFNPC